MALNPDFSALTKYTDQLQFPIIRNTMLPSTLMSLGVDVYENVTYKSTIPIMNRKLSVKSGHDCTPFSSGASASAGLTQLEIQSYPMRIEEETCPDIFKEYFTKAITKSGSYNEAAPSEYNAIYTAYTLQDVENYNEDTFFCGSLSGTYSSTLNKAPGVMWELEYGSRSSGTTIAGSHSGAWTSTNAIDNFFKLKNACPKNIQSEKDLIMPMSNTNFNALTEALFKGNYFHYNNQTDSAGNRVISNALGTNIKVIAMRGMDYTNKVFLTNASNLMIITDLVEDYKRFKVWFSDDAGGVVRQIIKWRFAGGVKFTQNAAIL